MIIASTSFWNILNVFELIHQLIFVIRLRGHEIASSSHRFVLVTSLTGFVFSWRCILWLSLIQILRQDLILPLPAQRILQTFILWVIWAFYLTLLHKMLTVQLMNNISFFHLNIINISISILLFFLRIQTFDLLSVTIDDGTRQHLRSRILFLICLDLPLHKFLKLLFIKTFHFWLI